MQQPFDMNLFLAAQGRLPRQAMTYNEHAQVLETRRQGVADQRDQDAERRHGDARGRRCSPNGSWLKSAANQAIAVKVIKASLEGWIYCRDHQADCVNITLQYGPTLAKGHQPWMMNEINKLIWPADAGGIGVMDKAAYNQTASISKQFGVVKKAPSGRVSHRPGGKGGGRAQERRHRRRRFGLEGA